MSAKFGPAGNSDAFSAVHKSSLAAPQWIAEQGLDCYEYQCGKGVHVGEDTARRVGENARKHGISLSLHAPYFINLANPDPDSLQKTIGYITAACLVASRMGAARVVIHSGALMKRTRREALDTALPLPEGGDPGLRRPGLRPHRPVSRRPWARSTSWEIWRRCWSCAPWTSA